MPPATQAALATTRQIATRILTVRGLQVLLDSQLAEMYGVDTKALNRAMRRNPDRFPPSFCFQLEEAEWENLRCQIGTSSSHGGSRYRPHVFTEQGVAMLSAVLRSETAVNVSVRIMDAFVEMRRFLLGNAPLFQKVEQLELRQIRHIADSDEKFNRIFNSLEGRSKEPPPQGIFFEGQLFDAYQFMAELIRSARKSIILVDNYVDDTVLTMLAKRHPSVTAVIYTKKISKELALDLEKHNAQYPPVQIVSYKGSHDRFLILDFKTLYHIGASLKDLGKQCFAFSRMDFMVEGLLAELPSRCP